MLSEPDTKALLRAWGLPTPNGRVVASREEAHDAANAVGLPVTLKIVAREIVHKTEVGGVRTGCRSVQEVEEAFDAVLTRVTTARPDVRIDGVLVEQHIQPLIECIVGIKHDAEFGPVVLFGLGGVNAELMGDVAVRVAPFSVEEAHRMIADTRCATLLAGWRGRPRGDARAMAQFIAICSALAADSARSIVELDINPVGVMPAGQGVVALDASASIEES